MFNEHTKKMLYSFIIFMAAIIQVTLLDSFKIFGVKPDLLLIIVIFAGLFFNLKWAFALGIFAGILKDSLSASSFGINTLLFPLWIFLIIKLSKKIPLDNNLICVMLVFVIGIFHNTITRIIFFALGNSLAPLGIFLRMAFLEILYTAAILPLMFKFIKSLLYPIEIE